MNYLDKTGVEELVNTISEKFIDHTSGEIAVDNLTEEITDPNKFPTTKAVVDYVNENNRAISEILNSLEEKTEGLVETSYQELVNTISEESLVPGRFYRITDYITTTVQKETKSAEHQFDVIVLAVSKTQLAPEAWAALHEGDTYFTNAGADLSKWELRYDINNDTTKYQWADPVNGKGVIYWMKDEWGNELEYDFKNIMYLMYKIKSKSDIHLGLGDAEASYPFVKHAYEEFIKVFENETQQSTIFLKNIYYGHQFAPHANSNTTALYYTGQEVINGGKTYDNGWVPDTGSKYINIMFSASSMKFFIIAEIEEAGYFYSFDNYNSTTAKHEDLSFHGDLVYKNKIGGVYAGYLPRFVFMLYDWDGTTGNYGCYGNVLQRVWCCYASMIFYNNHFRTVNIACMNGWYKNTIETVQRTYSDFCGYSGSTIQGVYSVLSMYMNQCFIGGGLEVVNTSYLNQSVFARYCYDITGGMITRMHLGRQSMGVTFGDAASGLYINGKAVGVSFGDYCYNITTGSIAASSFGEYCNNIVMGNENSVTFGDACSNIALGQASINPGADTSDLQSYMAVEFAPGTTNVNLYCTQTTSSNQWCQKITVRSDVSGTSATDRKVIAIDEVGQDYETVYQSSKHKIIEV